jgi:hypothetical protein
MNALFFLQKNKNFKRVAPLPCTVVGVFNKLHWESPRQVQVNSCKLQQSSRGYPRPAKLLQFI